jgi:hypothetical protein
MAQRLELQALLTEITDNVYFQPPPKVELKYPCIVYHRDYRLVQHADNFPHMNRVRYLVTVMDRNPDSVIPDLVSKLPMCSFDRWFASDGINHDVFRLYF